MAMGIYQATSKFTEKTLELVTSFPLSHGCLLLCGLTVAANHCFAPSNAASRDLASLLGVVLSNILG